MAQQYLDPDLEESMRAALVDPELEESMRAALGGSYVPPSGDFGDDFGDDLGEDDLQASMQAAQQGRYSYSQHSSVSAQSILGDDEPVYGDSSYPYGRPPSAPSSVSA
eukprot:2684570-Pyramimonas_sp.AAC.1